MSGILCYRQRRCCGFVGGTGRRYNQSDVDAVASKSRLDVLPLSVNLTSRRRMTVNRSTSGSIAPFISTATFLVNLPLPVCFHHCNWCLRLSSVRRWHGLAQARTVWEPNWWGYRRRESFAECHDPQRVLLRGVSFAVQRLSLIA